MEPISIVLLFILVGFAAFFFAPLGLGGGLLFVPILHYVAGWEITPVTLLTSLILTAADLGLAELSIGAKDYMMTS